jgi:hypothetical protein
MHSLDSLHMALSTLQHWDAQLSSTAAGYSLRLYAGFYTISILASLWVYYVARRLSPGPWRALACLPVVALQLAATPLLVDHTRTAVLIVPVCGTLSLSAFKVIPGLASHPALHMHDIGTTFIAVPFGGGRREGATLPAEPQQHATCYLSRYAHDAGCESA